MRTRTIALGTAMVALIAAGCSKQEEASAQPKVVPTVTGVTLATIETQDAPDSFEATGTVKAQLNSVLASKVSGRVLVVGAREGETVVAGQPLVVLDSRELSAAVDIASSNRRAAIAGANSAESAANMEAATSDARVVQARAAVTQSQAALKAAQAKYALALAGPRQQERTQAKLAVTQAEANMRLAKTELDRIARLVSVGALAGKMQDTAQTAYDVAKAQYDSAVESEKISQEGTRAEDLRAAKEGVDQAAAAVAQAKAALTQAIAARMQVAVRRSEVQSASAQVGQAEAAIRAARATLGNATISAPFNGIVTFRSVDPGAMASPGSPLMTIEGGEMRLEASVPESLMQSIRLGDTVPVRVDALGGKTLSAVATEINPSGNAATHSFVVKLRLPSVPGLKSGMFGKAAIVTGHSSRVTVPASALAHREGLDYVYVVNSEHIARLRLVTLGKVSGDRSEVLSGLTSGEQVVVSGVEKVTDGAEVR